MNDILLQTQIFYELSMAIGNGMDLDAMLKMSLTAYLRKLNCSIGMVFQTHTEADGRICFTPIMAIPRNARNNKVCKAGLAKIPEKCLLSEFKEFQAALPLIEAYDENQQIYILELQGFGLLLLVHAGEWFGVPILRPLAELNRKLAKACIFCRQSEMLAGVNRQLRHEIEERKQAETRLQDLLADLENIVKDRTRALTQANVKLKEEVRERIETTESLRKANETLEQIFKCSPAAIVGLDREARVMLWNETAEKIFGWNKHEVIGKPYPAVPDEHREEFEEIFRMRISGASVKDLEIVRKTKSGKIIQISASMSPMRNREGDIFGYISIMSDITERKRAEAERRKLEEQLQWADKLKSIGILAGGVAHDFNNLLMGIQGRTSLILSEMDEASDHFEHLKSVESYVQSASDLTRQLLGFARGGKYEVKPTDLNELVKNSAEMFGRTRKEIRITHTFEKALWVVDVDRRQIEQVLLNLYLNAWQAMPSGGQLSINTRNLVLDEDYCSPNQINPGRYVEIAVSDTGVGINETMRQCIFDPFFTTKEKSRGTGLGLASAYGIINNHNGLIRVESEEGQGTSFFIYLPATDKPAHYEKPLEGDYIKGSELILLVDDEEIVTEVGVAMLENLGYEVMTAQRGEDALEIVKNKKEEIDLVILDLILPGMDGSEIFKYIRNIRENIPVLLSSGYAINRHTEELLQKGANGFIQKPFSMTELSRKIRDIFNDS